MVHDRASPQEGRTRSNLRDTDPPEPSICWDKDGQEHPLGPVVPGRGLRDYLQERRVREMDSEVSRRPCKLLVDLACLGNSCLDSG